MNMNGDRENAIPLIVVVNQPFQWLFFIDALAIM